MKERKKLIFFGTAFNVLLLSVSVAFSTVAWFIGSSYLEVANINIQIATEQIEITTDPIEGTWTTSLNKEELKQTEYFIPCSSMYSDVWQAEHLERPIFKTAYTELSSNIMNFGIDMEEDHGYFSQELFFKATSNCYMYVDPETSFARANYARNKEKARNLRGREGINDSSVIEKYLNTIERSIRISLLVLNDIDIEDKEDPEYYKDYHYYIIDPYKTEKVNPDDPEDTTVITYPTLYGGIMDALDPDGFIDDYEGKEVLYGQLKNTDKICYSNPVAQDIPLKGEYRTCFDARRKAGVYLFDEEASFANGFEIVEEPSIPLLEADDPVNGVRIPLKAGVPKRIIMSIYLEGWDRDNTDLTTDGAFETCLAFKMSMK